MNPLSVYTNIYGRLYNQKIPYWVLTPFRRLVRKMANVHLPHYFKNGKNKYHKNKYHQEKDLIVSLTSFPARICNVWKVIESLKRQSVLPEKIILWLSKEQFAEAGSIPESLLSLIDNIFEICLVDGDIRSHKKYYYVLQRYPNASFITCDDDVFYDTNMVRRLLDTSKLFPKCIIANHTARLVFSGNGNIGLYSDFLDNVKPYSFDNLIQIGIGGVLYPPNSLHEMVLDRDLFMKLTPYADDIWLNAMARLKGTLVVQSSNYMLPLPIEDKSPSLTDINNGERRNDQQIKNVIDYLTNSELPNVYSSTYKLE